jgi:hypothetical protein
LIAVRQAYTPKTTLKTIITPIMKDMAKRNISIITNIFKYIFIVLSITLFSFKGYLDLADNIFWRDVNEICIILFLVLIIIELILKFGKKQWILTLVCIGIGYLMSQGAFPDGTNLEAILNGHF